MTLDLQYELAIEAIKRTGWYSGLPFCNLWGHPDRPSEAAMLTLEQAYKQVLEKELI